MSIKIIRLVFFLVIIFFSPSLAYAGNPPSAANSSLTATQVPADGTQSTITVTLKDASGTPLAGDTVKLSNTIDKTIVFSPASAVLNASGSATFNAASSTPGTDSIDVIDVTTNTALTALGKVTFTPAPTSATPVCSNTAPTVAPNLYSIVAVNDSATVYFSPPSLPFDGFTISYGLDASANSYNTSFKQGATTGAIKYTVNSLSPNTKYYFKVRANNGCATGPWSNVLSSTNSKPPVTGSSDVVYFGIAAVILAFGGLGLFVRYH